MLRTFIAIVIGKSIFFASRILKLGGGFAAPGLYALKIDPDLVKNLSSQISKNIIITGTNGKTTTASMLSHLLKQDNLKIIGNKTGSNLERGIASVLIKHSSFFGKIPESIAVWEVDEAAFNSLALKLNPGLIVFLNVYRDQLDRYGEVDSIVNKWVETVKKLPVSTKLLINEDDGSLEKISVEGHDAEFFSVEGLDIPGEKKFTGKRKAKFTGTAITGSFERSEFVFNAYKQKIPISISIPGIYNICNAVAALSAKFLINGLEENKAQSLIQLNSSFGRSEKFIWEKKECFIFLIKNPVGSMQVFETVIANLTDNDTLLIALNDNYADGRDVSWIWDIELEKFKIQSSKFKIYVSGLRAYDMALRLKYSGVKNLEIEENLSKAIEKAAEEAKGRVFILPTYTAMLQLQKMLVKRGIKKEYWK